MRIKRGNVDNSIKYCDALRCKFRQIGIYSSTDYLKIDSCETLNLLLSNSDLPLMRPFTIDYINSEIIFAQQINKATNSSNIIQEVCDNGTGLYNEELHGNGNNTLEKICHQLACLQQKSFPNKRTMR